MAHLRILSMLPEHWDAVSEIYQLGMDTGIATFETRVPDRGAWFDRHLEFGCLVAVRMGAVLGWAALSPVSSREVYKGVAEVSLYVHPEASGQGVGHALMQALIRESELHGVWTLHAAVFPQNKASIRLHLKSGFRIIGVRERIAQRNGTWYDNVLLERRSPKF